MPELPEVETVRRTLAAAVIGRRITGLIVREPRLRQRVEPELLKRTSVGQTIVAVRRRAKYLLVDLSGGAQLLVHLGMSGRLRIVPHGAEVWPHDHLCFFLDDGRELRFNDARRFGLVVPLQPGEAAGHPLLRDLGVEPLEGQLSAQVFKAQCQGRRRPVKNFLLDSHFIVGVGNIYASEALFRAGIDPRAAVGRLSLARFQRLLAAVVETLDDAILQGGTTLRDFIDVEGHSGAFAVRLLVYGRKGQPCKSCGQPIRQLTQANRSTYFCGHCQRR